MSDYDKKELANIAKASPVSRGIFKILSERDREPRLGMLELRRLTYDMSRAGIKVIPSEFKKTFEKLQEAGVGKLIEREGKPMSFKWNTSMKEITIAGLSEAASYRRSPATGHESGHDKSTSEVSVMLGPKRGASVSVPSDLTEEEAEFLFHTLLSKIRR